MPGEPILIVDDTPVNLKLTRILLAGEGFEVRTAPDAEEALRMLATWRPRLILLDIRLPGMSGLDLARKLRCDPDMAAVAIVALTANAMKGDEEKALAAGCDGYIAKPIDTRALPGQVRHYLTARPAIESAPPPAPPTPDDSGLDELKKRFLAEGTAEVRRMLDICGPGWDQAAAQASIHQWIGAGALLGFAGISALARQTDALLRAGDDTAAIRVSLEALAMAFESSHPPVVA